MAFPNKFPKINQELLSQLRGLFFSKDNPVMLPNNGFIGLHSIDTPATLPPFPYRFIYIKADGCVYILDYNGIEYRIMSLDSFGNLIIDNNLTVNNNLIVLGASTFGDSITVNDNINITGQYQINGYNDQKLLASFLDLPAKVGIWYAGDIERSTGNINEAQSKALQLAYNGNPTINYLSNGIAYTDMDGTGDFWNRADETNLDILGTESWAANKGLSIITWALFDNPTAANPEGILTKDTIAAGGRSYALFKLGTSAVPRFVVSADGTAVVGVSSTQALVAARWYHIAATYEPSTELAVFVNGVKTVNTTSIPAAIFNTATALVFGAFSGTTLMAGNISIASLHANKLSDTIVLANFQQTKSLYGVS